MAWTLRPCGCCVRTRLLLCSARRRQLRRSGAGVARSTGARLGVSLLQAGAILFILSRVSRVRGRRPEPLCPSFGTFLRLFAGGSDPTPLIGATSIRTLSPKRWLPREACDIWLPWRRRSPLGSEWPRLRLLAIKYEASCQFFFEQRFSISCTTCVFLPIFLKRRRGLPKASACDRLPVSSHR